MSRNLNYTPRTKKFHSFTKQEHAQRRSFIILEYTNALTAHRQMELRAWETCPEVIHTSQVHLIIYEQLLLKNI